MSNRIREHRERRGWSMTELARRVVPETSPQQIQRLEKGERKLTQTWMERLAAALDTTPQDLLPRHTAANGYSIVGGDTESSATDRLTPVQHATSSRVRWDIVPLRVLHGSGEDTMSVGSQVIDHIERVPQLRGVDGAYCLEVRGDALRPFLREGSILHVSPFRRPKRDDIVLVFTDDHTVMVKLYRRQTERGYELDPLRPGTTDAAPLTVPLGDVSALHVVETIDR